MENSGTIRSLRSIASLALATALAALLGGCVNGAAIGRIPAEIDDTAMAVTLHGDRLVASETGRLLGDARPDTAAVTAFLALPQPERERRHGRAVLAAQAWSDFWAWDQKKGRLGPETRFGFKDRRRETRQRLSEAIARLREAVAGDPTVAQWWLALADFGFGIGDLGTARADLAMAARTVELAPAAADADLGRRIALVRGWTLRELGLWEDGLTVVSPARERFPDDWEIQLLEGLLLAGAGRVADACAAATDLPAAHTPWVTVYTWGMTSRPTDYASRWIRAMAFHAAGDTRLARHALGDLQFVRSFCLHMDRFWNDAGLVLEAVEDPLTSSCYGTSFITRPLQHYYPVTPVSWGPVVRDRPAPSDAFFRSYGELYLSGSRFAHAAALAARALSTSDPDLRVRLGERAVAAVERCRRWHVWPAHVHALSGRLRLDLGELSDARRELAAARQGFAAQGIADHDTDLRLALVDLQLGDPAGARLTLEQAVATAPENALGWRALGVALAALKDCEAARRAMDRAVELDPDSAVGFYNRGLLLHSCGDVAAACEDLRRAVELDPQGPGFVAA
ncbi:MAG: tetratricopeptide repeat protein [Candidatus Krumholzibacteriia bacterium]